MDLILLVKLYNMTAKRWNETYEQMVQLPDGSRKETIRQGLDMVEYELLLLVKSIFSDHASLLVMGLEPGQLPVALDAKTNKVVSFGILNIISPQRMAQC